MLSPYTLPPTSPSYYGHCLIMVPAVPLQAAADVLALSSLEVDLANIQEGQTVTVKWRGKPVFIKHRTDEEVAESNAVEAANLRDAQVRGPGLNLNFRIHFLHPRTVHKRRPG